MRIEDIRVRYYDQDSSTGGSGQAHLRPIQGDLMNEQPMPERLTSIDPVKLVEGRFSTAPKNEVGQIMVVGCIDGRKETEPGVNVPAGDAGILAVEVNTIEDLLKQKLPEEIVAKIVSVQLKINGGAYLHTDMHAAQHMVTELQTNTGGLPASIISRASADDGAKWFARLVQNPAELLMQLDENVDIALVQNALLELMSKYMGCGHLAQMDARSEEYKSTQGTVGKMIRSLLKAKWAGENVAVEFLHGDHNELALAKYEQETDFSAQSVVPLVIPLVDGEGIFPIYPQISTLRHHQHYAEIMQVLEESGYDVSGFTEEMFVAQATLKENTQAGLTMPVLAAKLPSKEIPIVSVVDHADGKQSLNLVGSFKAA